MQSISTKRLVACINEAAFAFDKRARALRLAGRPERRGLCLNMLAQLPDRLELNHCPFAMILLTDPDAPSPDVGDIIELGLTPAERLLVAAPSGKMRVREVAPRCGDQTTTLRRQASFILKKLGVTRADPTRILSNIPSRTSAGCDS